jgi:hypothetical protein
MLLFVCCCLHGGVCMVDMLVLFCTHPPMSPHLTGVTPPPSPVSHPHHHQCHTLSPVIPYQSYPHCVTLTSHSHQCHPHQSSYTVTSHSHQCHPHQSHTYQCHPHQSRTHQCHPHQSHIHQCHPYQLHAHQCHPHQCHPHQCVMLILST